MGNFITNLKSEDVIKVSSITKNYGNNKGVFDLSFSVNKGEVFGFLGPNGAGKTTTIRQLMGFIKPDKGSVSICGLDCFEKRDVIANYLGYLSGEIAFMDDMTGMQFLKFIAQLNNVKDFSYTNELCNYFEINPNFKIKKMSKGMKQKIGIICAFMKNPDILILDEPTSGLDPLMQNKFTNLILEKKKEGKTILMSSHIFEEIEKTCDKVAIIKNGKMVLIDKIENIRLSKSKHFKITFNTDEDI
ncbi:MAG: ATP-binding cassette domain-containing protein, partial [Oscillospiraceae bacterium]